jgi:hypothetical protein
LERYKSPGSDQIPAELIQAGETLQSEIHKLINSVWNNKEFPESVEEVCYCTHLQEGR